jgi:hypothetical protein
MKTIKSTPTRRSLVSLSFAALLIAGLAGCSGGDSQYVGAYEGSSGSTVLTLEEDGVATYGQAMENSQDEAGVGTWEIEDNVLTVETESLGYEIYADVEGNPNALMFTSDDSDWSDEIFTKK